MDTHCDGPTFFSHRDGLTTRDVVDLCRDLSLTFGRGYAFCPEPITEGGILMERWPEKKPNDYKSIRFHPRGKDQNDRWPRIEKDTLKNWNTGPNKMIFRSKLPPEPSSKKTCELYIDTFLKALHGAPVWTRDEVSKLSTCFEALKFHRITKLPTKKHLRQQAFTSRDISQYVLVI